MSITITEKAASQVRSLMKEQQAEEHHLRVGVTEGGCCGLEYFLAFDTDIQETDEVSEYFGLKVLVDQVSLPYLEGATLDFASDLMNSGFVFSNPNATRTCGCGHESCG